MLPQMEMETTPDSATNQPPVDKKEADAWLWLDWANSVYSQVGMSGFLPICVQQAAVMRSGFPMTCPNVITDPDQAMAAFPAHNWTTAPVMFAIGDFDPDSCYNTGPDPACSGGYCRGLPTTVNQCLELDGVTQYNLGILGPGSMNPTAFTTTCISLSVFTQLVAFISLGSVADYGPMRKTFLTLFTAVGSVSMVCVLIISPQLFWLGGILMIISNVCFGMTQVLYCAYLPVLVAHIPDTLDRSKGKWSFTPNVWARLPDVDARLSRFDVDCRRSEELSNAGFAFGYFSGLVGLVLCVPLIFLLTGAQTTIEGQTSIVGYQLSMAFVGVWWGGFYLACCIKDLRARPGPPLPAGMTYITQSLVGFKGTVAALRQHPAALQYLLLWFFFSDGVFVIGTIATLFADAEIEWGCIPKSLGLLALTILASISAGLGNLFATRVQVAAGLSPQAMLMASLLLALSIPLYGMTGLMTKSFGLHKGWELLVLAVVYGLSVGPMQGFSRTLFGSLIPPGKESAFFSLYEVTDKGSSFIGPLVLGAIAQATGSMRLGLIYSIIFITVPLLLIPFVDIAAGYEAARAAGAAAVGPAPPASSWECASDRPQRAHGEDDGFERPSDDRVPLTSAAAV